MNTDLGLTPGIEVGRSTAADYKRNLRKLIRYLEGEREKLLKELEKTMKQAAKQGNFELAQNVSDKAAQTLILKGLTSLGSAQV